MSLDDYVLNTGRCTTKLNSTFDATRFDSFLFFPSCSFDETEAHPFIANPSIQPGSQGLWECVLSPPFAFFPSRVAPQTSLTLLSSPSPPVQSLHSSLFSPPSRRYLPSSRLRNSCSALGYSQTSPSLLVDQTTHSSSVSREGPTTHRAAEEWTWGARFSGWWWRRKETSRWGWDGCVRFDRGEGRRRERRRDETRELTLWFRALR